MRTPPAGARAQGSMQLECTAAKSFLLFRTRRTGKVRTPPSSVPRRTSTLKESEREARSGREKVSTAGANRTMEQRPGGMMIFHRASRNRSIYWELIEEDSRVIGSIPSKLFPWEFLQEKSRYGGRMNSRVDWVKPVSVSQKRGTDSCVVSGNCGEADVRICSEGCRSEVEVGRSRGFRS